ncbi:RDD family protein [Croceivirga thetidis]|uniref:RDD family protein n=1 Tax=Croceivirga thetidis TaxID=2721623 RepID=A0ABX1GN22_9FLAO|nr:RDD family protein [Croceivirga thetidis]NKI30964.1 RDD family protein [Croceivirga thetidis]
MDVNENQVEYADFGIRLGAYLLDALILAPIAIAYNYLNFTYFKSFWTYLLFFLLMTLYKPFFEFKFGATLGKMACKLKVTDHLFQQIDFEKSLTRSLIFIIPSVLNLAPQYLAYSNPSLMDSGSFWQFNTLISQTYPLASLLGCLTGIIVLVDLIVLLTDDMKKQRSLHDRIAKTYVIRDK